MRKLWVLCALALVLAASPAWGATFTMGYPPPGGVTFAPFGSGSGSPNGETFTYTGFSPAQYKQLYWGLNAVANVNQGVANGNMQFAGYNSMTGIAVWTSTANWVFTSGTNVGCCSTPTQLLVQLQPFTGMNGFLASGFLNPTAMKGGVGIPGDPNEPLFQVVGTASYQATFEFMTWDGVPADAGNPLLATDIFEFNANNNGGPGVTTSVDFEFWWSYNTTKAKIVQVGTCLSSLQSFPSISAAVSAVTAGATVDICPGTYPEQLTLTLPITLAGVVNGNSNAAILTVPSSGLTQNGNAPVSGPHTAQILVQDVGPVTIKNLIVDGTSGSCPPPGNIDGIAFLSNTGTASGKVLNSSVRNTGNGTSCMLSGNGIYAEGASSLSVAVQGNSVSGFGGNGITFAVNQAGTISGNAIHNGGSTGIALFSPGSGVKITSNNISGVNNAVTLSSASSAVVQTNIVNSATGTAFTLNESGGGGANNVTKNTVNDANCAISNSQAAATDVFLPNTLLNTVSNLCP